MKNKYRALSFIMAAVICLLTLVSVTPGKAYAASKYITVEEFTTELVKALELKPVTNPEISASVDALMSAGIIKKGEFKDYSKNLVRADAAILISRADEYLYKTEVDDKLIQTVIEKRISDINSLSKSKWEEVAKAYIKGYIKGYSNGNFAPDREMRGKQKVTRDGVLNMIKMLSNPSLRSKVSPDGQLLRTTNLPKNAERFPYILASYPNAYYDRVFEYETIHREAYDMTEQRMKEKPYVRMVDYAWPVDVPKFMGEETYNMVVENYLDTWVEKAKKYTELIFNVDYRTIDEEWADKVYEVSSEYESYDFEVEAQRKRLNNYINQMKENKTIIECGGVAVDGSSLFWSEGAYFLRVYVKYRIKSSALTPEQCFDMFCGGDLEVYSRNIIYNDIQFVYLPNFKIGKWETTYYDLILAAPINSKDEFDKGAGYFIIRY